MIVIEGNNVNDTFQQFLTLAKASRDNGLCREISPRGMKTLEVRDPVATVYRYPKERVLFDPLRDANPFFHLMEALWILAGRNDVAFLDEFNKQMVQFSDDGKTFRGAYGYRLRVGFHTVLPNDQIAQIKNLFKKDPETRRAVLAMWIPGVDDVTMDTKDLPCNTHIYLKIHEGALDMAVCCRSNDALLGCYGANMVHFSVLQEYLAAYIGVKVGTYTQISDSLHVYTESPVWERLRGRDGVAEDLYMKEDRWGEKIEPFPLVDDPLCFDIDLHTFFAREPRAWGNQKDPIGFSEPFFKLVVFPMIRTWFSRKDAGARERVGDWYHNVQQIHASDWRTSCLEWCERREPQKEENLGYR